MTVSDFKGSQTGDAFIAPGFLLGSWVVYPHNRKTGNPLILLICAHSSVG